MDPVPAPKDGTAPAAPQAQTPKPLRPEPLTSLALALPVFLVYHLGLLLISTRASTDFVSSLAFALLEASVPGYVICTLGLALGLSLWVWIQQKRGVVQSWAIGRVLLESALYALLLLVTVGWAVYRLGDTRALASAQDLSTFAKVVLAAGSGFHEELLFRVLLVTGGAALLGKLGLKRGPAVGLAVLMSSFAFALCRFVGPLGDTFALDALFYQALAGVALAAVYLLRGFAVAVYTHAFYAALVFFVYA